MLWRHFSRSNAWSGRTPARSAYKSKCSVSNQRRFGRFLGRFQETSRFRPILRTLSSLTTDGRIDVSVPSETSFVQLVSYLDDRTFVVWYRCERGPIALLRAPERFRLHYSEAAPDFPAERPGLCTVRRYWANDSSVSLQFEGLRYWFVTAHPSQPVPCGPHCIHWCIHLRLCTAIRRECWSKTSSSYELRPSRHLKDVTRESSLLRSVLVYIRHQI